MVELQPNLALTSEEATRVLGAWLQRPVVCSAVERLKGGMVNSVFRLEFDQAPYRAVIKLHSADTDDFEAEAVALRYLRSESTCPVPEVHHNDASGNLLSAAYLLLEHIDGVCLQNVDLRPDQRRQVDEQLAHILGQLHSIAGPGYGHVHQMGDGLADDWASLFVARLAELRAEPAVVGWLDSDVLAAIDGAIEMAPAILVDVGPPRLVHGDVWEGNIMVREVEGEWRIVALLDPNLQFAPTELELAYLDVFDNERPDFFAAYHQTHERAPGYERRRLFYWLHTALVHVALFDEEFFRQYTARVARQIVQAP